MKKTTFTILAAILCFSLQAQTKLVTNNGKAVIYSHTVAEDISAENSTVTGIIDEQSGVIAISVPVQGFRFEKTLMQEHFNNDRFMDSKKFPRISLKGKINDLSNVNFQKDGQYEVTITGDLTIKGVTKAITEKAHVTIKNGVASVHCKFVVKDISSYGVGKPMGGKKNNVADDIEVTYTAAYEKE